MKVAISGAGVAGAALAHWLHRTGHTPTLIEQAPKFRTGGYMIDFWGVGYRVARRMGIEETLRDTGYDVRCVRSVGPDGTAKAELGVEVFRRMLGDDFISLPRGDLAEAIYHTIDGKIDTLFGDSIATIDQHAEGVRLTFEEGPPDEFDLVIGADGLHSNVRRLVSGPEENFEHYLGCKVAAGELQRADGDHRRAFDAYQTRLRPFIKDKQAGAERLIGFFATKTRFGLGFRHAAMRTMNLSPVARLFAGNVRDDIELPEYPA